MRQQFIVLVLIFCGVALLSACGQSGKLYLPDTQKQEEATA